MKVFIWTDITSQTSWKWPGHLIKKCQMTLKTISLMIPVWAKGMILRTQWPGNGLLTEESPLFVFPHICRQTCLMYKTGSAVCGSPPPISLTHTHTRTQEMVIVGPQPCLSGCHGNVLRWQWAGWVGVWAESFWATESHIDQPTQTPTLSTSLPFSLSIHPTLFV